MEHNDGLLLRSSPSEDTTPEMGLLLGHALSVRYPKVVVGMDLMQSSSMMMNAVIAGLVSSGADVIDIGVVSGPVAAYAARKGDCCVYVTEFRQRDLVSGYLLISPDGSYFDGESLRALNHDLEEDRRLPDYKSIGSVKKYYNATMDYNNRILALSKDTAGGSVVLNCNCGTATDSAPQILTTIGADIISINAQKDRNFVSNSLSTKEADIKQMKALVEANNGSIGISLNRIGTLMKMFDEKGEPMSDEHVLALIILYLRPKRIVVPMDTSCFIEDLFRGKIGLTVNTPNGVPDAEQMEIIYTHPSASSIHKAMVEHGADIGFFDGGIAFVDISLGPDAIYASVILSQFAGSNNISEKLSEFPEYYSEKKDYRFSCSPDDFIRMMEQNAGNVSPTVFYENRCWRVNMPGGAFSVSLDDDSEDVVHVVAESNDRLYLISMIEVIDGLMAECTADQ